MTYSLQGSSITLAEELPDQDLFPLIAEHTTHLSDDILAVQNENSQGYMPLRAWLQSEWQQHKGIEVDVNQILLTTGTEQGMEWLTRVYVDQGDTVLVENPTSPSILELLRMRGATIIPIDGDAQGVLLHTLEESIKTTTPKFLFVTPNFTNPTGVIWSIERRAQVLDLCRRHHVLIVEDDTYGDLYFDEATDPLSFSKRYPSLFTLDGHEVGGQVLYLGSFNKTVAPELRTGWVVGNRKLIELMSAGMPMADCQSNALNQRLLYQLLVSTTFDWRNHIALVRHEYNIRLELMKNMLKKPVWRDARYELPSGGMFIWIKLPEGLRSEALLKCSIRKGVDFCPGGLCCVDKGEGSDRIRLNFTQPRRDELIQGMHLIGEAVSEFTARS
ncbi:aminotransferase-like domain-containing protein [Paenibacillus macquariensis]|uniref:2-aminoadipate transaminase n=1 Tax=Paenibacillus macquariensis TaxID=948756 RepID=A0ABY1JSX7_9BACL|nr:PLP-dependent aminotransferase family protein [Paenibacillus macquariensis]MEC0092975.1 PLP-dependent aminotransferase family protein [Paenibacillus macquariensis]SIQ69887.1 2-aminoadipate transaminase [Paenibacillus macquariensis]